MNIKNLLKIKKQVQETDELLGDSNQASIAMANNYINAVKNHIESYKNAISQLPNKIIKIPINATITGEGIDYKFINNDKNFLKTLEENKKDLLRELSNYTYIGDDMTDGTDLYLAITQDDIDIIMDNLVDRLVDFGCKIVRTESVDVEDDCDYEEYVDGHVCSYVFNIYIQNPTK